MSRTCKSAREFIGGDVDTSTHFTLLVALRDFLQLHLPTLTEKQRRAVMAWAEGESFTDLAKAEGVTEEAIHSRFAGGITRLRELAREDGKKFPVEP